MKRGEYYLPGEGPDGEEDSVDGMGMRRKERRRRRKEEEEAELSCVKGMMDDGVRRKEEGEAEEGYNCGMMNTMEGI
ncbi:hypothetical protein LguiA_010661 [Lonicera macranthoides]